MITISILYPQSDGGYFDFEYYLVHHMPLSTRLLSTHPGYLGVTVERGVAGVQLHELPAYFAMCHFRFTSAEAFVAAFMPHAAVLQADIVNYTNTTPVIQFNERCYSH